jgi:hypothetical protein
VQEAEAKRDADLEAQMEAALGGGADDEDRLIEERRRRRQEILAKHQQQQQLSGELHSPSGAFTWPSSSALRNVCKAISSRHGCWVS